MYYAVLAKLLPSRYRDCISESTLEYTWTPTPWVCGFAGGGFESETAVKHLVMVSG